jgi:hypothetical protein
MADPIVNAPAHPDFPFASTLDTISALLTAAGKTHLLAPRLGIVCGSGLSTLASHIVDPVEIPYSALAGFGQGHGEFIGVPPGSPHAWLIGGLNVQSWDTRARLSLVSLHPCR